MKRALHVRVSTRVSCLQSTKWVTGGSDGDVDLSSVTSSLVLLFSILVAMMCMEVDSAFCSLLVLPLELFLFATFCSVGVSLQNERR